MAFKIGQATARFLKAQTLVVGHDARASSAGLAQKIKEGIVSVDCDAIIVGAVTTPLFYFSVNSKKADGGIMVTASHNPPEYNGFKIVGRDSVSIGIESGLLDIEKLTQEEAVKSEQTGVVTEDDMVDEYLEFLMEVGQVEDLDLGKLDVVIDVGNGMASIVLEPLLKHLNVNVIPLMFETLAKPMRGSDVSRDENVLEVKRKVVEMNADFGVAFDGDGDRIAIFDNLGQRVRPDILLGLLYQTSQKVVYDFRISRAVKQFVGPNGVASPVGHSHIKKIMREQNADIGVELSGHFFFKEMHYAESAALAMLKILKLVAGHREPFSEMVKPWSKEWHHSGEINLEIQNSGKIFESLKSEYSDGRISENDGLTVEYTDWWFNLRPSQTEPLVRLVVETRSEKETLERVSKLERQILSTATNQ